MLCISRRVGEELLFPDLGISVRVNEVRGGTVRLGITAPRHVEVLRRELLYPDKQPVETTDNVGAVLERLQKRMIPA